MPWTAQSSFTGQEVWFWGPGTILATVPLRRGLAGEGRASLSDFQLSGILSCLVMSCCKGTSSVFIPSKNNMEGGTLSFFLSEVFI